ncbi:MAG: 2-C-methyl-D-erythritol 4-phosphate cytidylyltransferase [Candidatus Binatia bacterium]
MPGFFFACRGATISDVKVALLMPAAGSGQRLGLSLPKGLVPIEGVPLVRLSLERFAAVDSLVEVIVAVPQGALVDFSRALEGIELPTADVKVLAGAATRQESVRGALDALESDADLVCVHDAARPMVKADSIDAVLAAAERDGAATVASRPGDSVRRDDGDGGTVALDRGSIWLVETPQAFQRELIEKAHREAKAVGLEATDDASLVEACGSAITVLESVGANPKITRSWDLELVRLMGGAKHRGPR